MEKINEDDNIHPSLFTLDIVPKEEAIHIHVDYNEEINKELLSKGYSVNDIIPEVLLGFIFQFCEEHYIDVERLIAEQKVGLIKKVN